MHQLTPSAVGRIPETVRGTRLGGALILGLVLAACSTTETGVLPDAGRTVSSVSPVNLRCEYRIDPVGIDELAPRLSWELVDPSGNRGVAQSGYRLLVASSPEQLAVERGDLWDTSVSSSESNQVIYAGQRLRPDELVYWKVQVTDGSHRRSGWSQVGRWTVGLQKGENWNASWIGLDTVKPSGAKWLPPAQDGRTYVPATLLRKDFVLGTAPARAVLYVTALGDVVPRLNGHIVSQERFTPGWTDYHKRLYYRAYDVTSLLRAGANTVGAVLGDGWFRGNIGAFGQDRYGKHTRLRAELHVYAADGSLTRVSSDATWRVSTGPILEDDLQAGESYDARLDLPGWDRPRFDETRWLAPNLGTEISPNLLIADPAPPVRPVLELPTLAVTEPKPHVYVFDLGQNFAGVARLKVREAAGTVLRLRFAEMVQPDGTGYFDNLRTARATDTYVCKGGGEETWEPYFTYHGFRYVQVEGLTRPPPPDTITGIALSTNNADTGSFASSNPLLNQLWSNVIWGQRSNYIDVPTDCPQRDERLGWTGDAQVFVRTGAYNQDIAAFMSKWIDDLDDTQMPDGRYNDTAPVGFIGTNAGWADAGVIVPWTLWRVYGDTRVLERHYDSLRRYMSYLRAQAPDFIGPNRGYGDWLAIGGITEKSLVSTAYLGRDAHLMQEIATVLGRSQDAIEYAHLFHNVRIAFQKTFVNADGSIGANRSQTAHLLALQFDLLTDDQRRAAIPHLLTNLESRNWRLGVGFLGINLLLPELTDEGHVDGAYYLIGGTEFPSWGYSISQGATTVWERWNSYTKSRGFNPSGMNSYNHYAYGSCGEWLYRTVLGIGELEPGFKKMTIRPLPGPGVNSASGSFTSIRGPVKTAWKVQNGQFVLDVSLPPNTSAEIHIPTDSAADVREGGQIAATARGISVLRKEQSEVVFSAGSGEYYFTSPFSGWKVTVTPPVAGKSNAAEEEKGLEKVEGREGGTSVLEIKIGVLRSNPGSLAILKKYIPEALANPDFAQADGSTLSELHDFAPEYFTEQKLKTMAAELSNVQGLAPGPAPASRVSPPQTAPSAASKTSLGIDSKVGDLMDNAATKAVLAKYLGAMIDSPQFAAARGITLAQLKPYVPQVLTDSAMKAIAEELTKLAPPSSKPTQPVNRPPAKFSTDSKVAFLLAEPESKKVLDKYLPTLVSSPQIQQARDISLRKLKEYLPELVTEEKLAAIDAEFGRLDGSTGPKASPPYTLDSKIGALLDNAATKAILQREIPTIVANPQFEMARGITLKQMQSYAAAILTDDKLRAIAKALAQVPNETIAPNHPEIYVPETVSPAWQAFLRDPPFQAFQADRVPDLDAAAWKTRWSANEETMLKYVPAILDGYKPTLLDRTIGGTPVIDIKPQGWKDDGRVILFCHGGGYTMGSAKSTLYETLLVASFTGVRVISVDYTVAPAARWQRITDQVIDVYKGLLNEGYSPKNIGMMGDSAGGSLAAASVLKLRDGGIAMPAAIVLWSPWSDITATGESYVTLRQADPLLSMESLKASADAYAAPADQKNPYVSPVYGDYTKGFPPTLIQGGTREIFLSNFVRQYQAIENAGGSAILDLYEGMIHVFQPMVPNSPESQSALKKVKAFLDRYLVHK